MRHRSGWTSLKKLDYLQNVINLPHEIGEWLQLMFVDQNREK
jgi:hypothetical protein